MFTGIIEEIGEVLSWDHGDRMRVRCSGVLKELSLGDSIAVNGVCLTVCDFDSHSFSVQVSEETKQRISLDSFSERSRVNLESALKAGEKMGGHIVQGHVDGVGKILKFEELGEYRALRLGISDSLLPYMVEKGSIAVDGISLTVNQVQGTELEIMIVPHTMGATTLGSAKVDGGVNIEADILGKYVYKNLQAWKSKLDFEEDQ
ncbi:riboflavin synthase [bacterium]|jgi:riboflavin synthase|nr:riboflavin synthase [bacterium]